MGFHLGNGWELIHLTDRVALMMKFDPIYRRITGRNGYVLQRCEPGMDRKHCLDKAVQMAKINDGMVADRVASDIVPQHVTRYHVRQRELATAFGVPGEEPSERLYRP